MRCRGIGDDLRAPHPGNSTQQKKSKVLVRIALEKITFHNPCEDGERRVNRSQDIDADGYEFFYLGFGVR